MKKLLLLVLLSVVSELQAFRHVGFQTDAFNRAYPASYANSMVFSPLSFELSAAILAESLETIPKANVSERMGIVLDFGSTYRPILEALEDRTNGLSVVSARGFCVPNISTAEIPFRHYLETTYGAEVLRLFPHEGAESWFRATMDGEMENFEIPVNVIQGGRYAFYDLVSVSAEWAEPFPTGNTREIPFYPDDSTNAVPVVAMADVRAADTWDNEDYTLLRLPLRGGASFFAMLPKKEKDLLPARQDMTSLEIDHLLTVTKSITEKGVDHGPCAIVLPRLELFSRTNFSAILAYFRIPTKGLVHVTGDLPAREHVQYTRFRLAEHGRAEKPLVRKDPEAVVPIGPSTRKLVFNRPFLFFVYQESTSSVLMAGQFFGR